MKEEKKNVGKDAEIDLEKDGGKICGGMVADGQVAVTEGKPNGALVSEKICGGICVTPIQDGRLDSTVATDNVHVAKFLKSVVE